MSRIGDLIDLLQATNEIYLINPNQNIRSAYIQIDDLCELTMKSWLQENVPSWSHISHQHNNRDYYKGFRTITAEIISNNSNNQVLPNLLNDITSRRDNRNNFFHNHNQVALTVNEESCLLAFGDIYRLLFELFGAEFIQRVQAKPVVRAQIAIIKLKLRSFQTRVALAMYQDVLGQKGTIELRTNSLGYEFCLLYDDATLFFRRIQEYFQNQIAHKQDKIERINLLQRPNKSHHIKLSHLNDEVSLVQSIIDECLNI